MCEIEFRTFLDFTDFKLWSGTLFVKMYSVLFIIPNKRRLKGDILGNVKKILCARPVASTASYLTSLFLNVA